MLSHPLSLTFSIVLPQPTTSSSIAHPHKTQSYLAFAPLHPTFAPVPPLTPLSVIPSLLD